jgi:hypothetical protein
MELVVGAEDGRSSRADFTACFMAKTVHTQQGTARKRRPPGTGCLGRNQPTTQEFRAHISTTPTTIQPWPRSTSTQPRIPTPPGGTNRTSPTPTSTPAIAKHPPPKPPPSTKTRRLRRSAVSRSHSHDHWGVQRRLRHEAIEEGLLPQHQPRRHHRSSRADKVVPCATDLRRQRCRPAQCTPHRCHGHQL